MVLSLMPSRFSASGQAFGSLYTTAQLPQSVNSMAVMAVCHAASPRQKHCEVACTMPRPACLAGQVRLTGKENQKVLSLKTRNLQRKDSPCVSSSTRHLVLARSQLVDGASSSASSPSTDATPYQNTFLDNILYKVFRSRCQEELGWTSSNPEFSGLIEESRRLLRKHRTKTEVEEATVRILRSLFPPHLLPLFKRLIPPLGGGKPAAVLLARVTQATCQWLMGRCSMNEVQLADGSMLQSGVLVEKCKYLEESKCAGICIHTCKIPTQLFISGDMGVPLTMEPNYEDFSCQFKFGVEPPPRDQDKALSTPCLDLCPVAAARQSIRYVPESQQCPQVS